jgi:hypothetical protein
MPLPSFQKPETTHTALDEQMDPRAFCRLRFSPMLATGVFIHLLREHFGNPKSIESPMLQRCIWRSGTGTGIVIESSSQEVLSNIGQRPAVLARRNSFHNERVIINDEVQVGGGMGREFIVKINGSHTLFNIASKPGHAEALADETTILFLEFSPEIRQSLCFEDFQLQEIGQLSRLEGSGGQYVVPVTYKYWSERSWTIDHDIPPIRHIDLRVLFNLE